MAPVRKARDARKDTKPPAVVIGSTSQVVLRGTLAVNRGTAARTPYEGGSHPRTTSIATREGWHPTGYLARVPRGLRGADNRAPLRARRAPLHARGPRRRTVVPPRGHTQGLQALRSFQGGHGEAAGQKRPLRRALPEARGAPPRLGRGPLRLSGGEGAKGATAAPPLGGSELCPGAARSLCRVRRGARGRGGTAAQAGGGRPTGVPLGGAGRTLRGGGRPGKKIGGTPEPPRPLAHGCLHARGRLQGHRRVQGGRSHRNAEAGQPRGARRDEP